MLSVAKIKGFREEIEEMEKQGFLGSLLMGAGLHVGANAAFKGFRKTHAGHRFEAGQMASGYNQGLAGKKINPIARNIATYGIGPESLVNYDVGRKLGDQMKPLSKGRRYKTLKKLRKTMAMSEHVQHAPIGKSVVPAVNRILANKKGIMDRIPTVASAAASTPTQKIISGGLASAAIALEPHTAIHMGINAARKGIATSPLGKRFMKNQFVGGVSQGPIEGAAGHLVDLGVSPAALDSRRIGAAMAAEHDSNPRLARRLGASFGQQIGTLPGVQEALTEKVKDPLLHKALIDKLKNSKTQAAVSSQLLGKSVTHADVISKLQSMGTVAGQADLARKIPLRFRLKVPPKLVTQGSGMLGRLGLSASRVLGGAARL